MTVHEAAERLQIAPSTVFRWRRRSPRLAQDVKAHALLGAVEADETYFLRSLNGQKVCGRMRRRGGRAAKRELSDEQVLVLVARDHSGASTDFILPIADKAHTLAALGPVLPSDAVLCTDEDGALAAMARDLGLEHHALNMSKGRRVNSAWHIPNVNSDHGRLKNRMLRSHGVATSYLASYLGWFRALDRSPQTRGQAASMLALAVGGWLRHQSMPVGCLVPRVRIQGQLKLVFLLKLQQLFRKRDWGRCICADYWCCIAIERYASDRVALVEANRAE